MNNILKLSAIVMLTFMANSSQATELVKVEPTNNFELLEIAKINLAKSIKLNAVKINSIEKLASTQVMMAQTKIEKHNDVSIKTTALAE